MAGKGSTRQERAEKARQSRHTELAKANPRTPHGGNDANIMEEEEPSLSSVVRLIESFRSESRSSMDTLQSTVDSFASRLTDVESSLQDMDNRITELEAKCDALSKSNVMLMSKTADLESRSRRQNLRILGVPEDTEGPQVTSFMSDFFAELLGIENSETTPLLDIAHRSLAAKPRSGAPPRPVIVKVHHFQVKQRILRLARERAPLIFRGHQVRIFPDFTVDVSKQRAAYTSIKQKLRAANVKYGLLFPARLQLTFNNERHVFHKPEAAGKYYEDKIAPAQLLGSGLSTNG